MYLIDTNVISEIRKGARANRGVVDFVRGVAASGQAIYLSTVSIGELRRGVELLRYRGDHPQADRLERWLSVVVVQYRDTILGLDLESADVWGRLRAPDPDPVVDKQIAAIAIARDLTVVTRNSRDFLGTGAKVLNPFSADTANA